MAPKPDPIIVANSQIAPVFLQKASACNNICRDHLNVALACVYCSGDENPKIHWFGASAWENHVHKHNQEGLPIFPDDLAFANLPPEAVPSTSGSPSNPLSVDTILKRSKVAKQYLEEEMAKITHSKCSIKQDPIKSSKKCKDE